MVTSGRKCITKRGADPDRGMSVGKAQGLVGQLVDVGGGNLSAFRVMALDTSIRHFFGIDNNFDGLFCCRRKTQEEAEEGQVFVHSLLDGKLEGFDQWLGGIGRGIGQP